MVTAGGDKRVRHDQQPGLAEVLRYGRKERRTQGVREVNGFPLALSLPAARGEPDPRDAQERSHIDPGIGPLAEEREGEEDGEQGESRCGPGRRGRRRAARCRYSGENGRWRAGSAR